MDGCITLSRRERLGKLHGDSLKCHHVSLIRADGGTHPSGGKTWGDGSALEADGQDKAEESPPQDRKQSCLQDPDVSLSGGSF